MVCPTEEREVGLSASSTDDPVITRIRYNTYRRWLREAITVTNAALDKINLRGQVAVGFYGTSGFIVFGNVGNPHGFLDERTLDAMSVLGMDDYPNPATNMGADQTSFETLYGQFPLMLTEWGTINETTDGARLAAMQSVLDTCKAKPYFYGLNYWTVVGGTGNANENILDSTTLMPIGGYSTLVKSFVSGAPQVVATHLATLTGATVQINAASPPSARQALVADSAGVARFQAVTKADVGLPTVPNVDATARANHTGTQAESTVTNLVTDLAAKAPLASPAFTGTVTLPSGTTLTAPVISTIANTGILTLPTSTDTLMGRATTDTLTNKRITKRVTTITSSTTPTPSADTDDVFVITALPPGQPLPRPPARSPLDRC